MPQIYWGYTNEEAPFDKTLEEWIDLTKNSNVKLYVGLQLYRMGTNDTGQSDHAELQDAGLIERELTQLQSEKKGWGILFFQLSISGC